MFSIGSKNLDALRKILSQRRHPSIPPPGPRRPLAKAWALAAALSLTAPVAALAQATTTTVVAVNPTSAAYGAPFKMTATVSVVGVPAHALRGSVTFTDTVGGTAHILGTAQLQSPSTFNGTNNTTSSVAVLQQTLGLIGSHTIGASFSANTYFTASTSNTSQVVKVTGTYPTSTSLVTNPGGTPGNWSLTATIVGLGSPTLDPSGTIFLQDTSNGNYVVSAPNVPVNSGAIARKTVAGPTSPMVVGISPWRIVTADFNGDGLQDLAVLNTVSGTVSILLGDGTGGFTNSGTIVIVAPGFARQFTPGAIATSDVNGDGKADLIVSVDTGNHLYVLTGNGDGTFTNKVQPSVTLPGASPTSLAIGDFNGDGIPDVVATNLGTSGQAFVYLNDGTGTFTTTTTTPIAVGNSPQNVVVGDFNKDGHLDFATANFDDDSITLLQGDGSGKNFVSSTINLPAGSGPYGIAVADFNGDGNLDLAVTEQKAATLAVLNGKGNGTFAAPAVFATGNTPGIIATGDFNNDGATDIAVTNFNDATVSMFLNTGTGSFGTGQVFSTVGKPGDQDPLGIVSADFDGDGNGDLAVANSTTSDNTATGATVVILLNQITDTATAAFNLITVPGFGNHPVDAVYRGDANFTTSTSKTVPLGASSIPTTTLLSTTTNSPAAGQQITLTATLSPSQVGNLTPAAGDTVTFNDGATVLGTSPLSGGMATLSFTFGNGTHNVTATFNGDPNSAPNFLASTSKTTSVVVGAVAPTTITWPTPAPIAYGTGLSGTQLNAVATSGGTSIPGTYIYSPSAGAILPAGTQTLNVTFTPTAPSPYMSASASVTIQVTQASPVITWANPAPITYGTPLDSIQLNAVATTTGTVMVPLTGIYNIYGEYDDGKTFATGGWDGGGNAYSTTGLGSSITWNGVIYSLAPANGLDAVANLATPIPVPSGNYTGLQILGAMVNNAGFNYNFTVNYTDGTSVVTTLNMSDWVYPQSFADESVVKCNISRNTYTGISDGHSTCVYGYSIPLDSTKTLKSILVPQSRNAVFLAFGLSTPPIPGTFAYTPPAGTVLSTGNHTLTTVFTPQDSKDYATSTATVPITVNQATVSLNWPQPAPILYGTPLGPTQLDAVATVNSGMVFPPVAADYSASAIFTDGQAFAVNGFGNTSTAYSGNLLGPSIVWSGTTFLLGQFNLPNGLTSATLPMPQESFNGLYFLAAANGNSPNQAFTVHYTDGTATTVLQSISGWTSPQNYAGESIAKSTAYLNTSTGGRLNVTNYVYGYQIPLNPAKTLSSVTLPNNANVELLALALSTSATPAITVAGTTTYNPAAGTVLPLGTNPLNASFTPSDTVNYSNATASTTILVTKDVGEMFTVSADNNPALPGTPVTFTAQFPKVAAGAATPTGTVTFFDNGISIGTATVTMTNGVASAVITKPSLTVGTHPITATYSGDTNYGAVTSPIYNEVIGKVLATVVPKGVPNPSAFTQSVTITITVTGISNTPPTGTIQLSLFGTALGPSLILTPGTGMVSTTSYTTTMLPAGSDNIVATYSGDANYN